MGPCSLRTTLIQPPLPRVRTALWLVLVCPQTSELSLGAWHPLYSDFKPLAADLQGEASRMEVFVLPTDEETGSETTWGELGSW